MKKEASLAVQQKAVGPVLEAILPMAPEVVKELISPICDTVKTCYCKEELTQIELKKIWASVAPQYLEQFGNFINLMGQVVDTIHEYDKLTVEQTNMIIEHICSDPSASFEEKQSAIRETIQNQQNHKEEQTKTYVKALGIAAGTISGTILGKTLSDNHTKRAVEAAKLAKESQKFSALASFSPSAIIKETGIAIKELGNTVVNIVNAVKK